MKYGESRQEGDMAAPRPPRLRETTSSLKLESFTCLYSGESIHLVWKKLRENQRLEIPVREGGWGAHVGRRPESKDHKKASC